MKKVQEKKVGCFFTFAALVLICSASANSGFLNGATSTVGLWQMEEIIDSAVPCTVPIRANELFLYGNYSLVDGYEGKALSLDGIRSYGKANLWGGHDSVKIEIVFRPMILGRAQSLVDVKGVFSLYIGSSNKIQWGTGGINLTNHLRLSNTDDWWHAIAIIDADSNRSITLTNLATGASNTYTDNGKILKIKDKHVFVGSSKDGSENFFCGMIDFLDISIPNKVSSSNNIWKMSKIQTVTNDTQLSPEKKDALTIEGNFISSEKMPVTVSFDGSTTIGNASTKWLGDNSVEVNLRVRSASNDNPFGQTLITARGVWLLYIQNDTLVWHILTDDGTRNLSLTNVIKVNHWHDINAFIDKSGLMGLVIDDKDILMKSGLPMEKGNASIYIGNRGPSNDWWFKGDIAEIEVSLCPVKEIEHLPEANLTGNQLEILHKAGNSSSDFERLELLKNLYEDIKDNTSTKQDLKRLLTSIDKWVNADDLFYYGGLMSDFNYEISKKSPFYGIYAFYRARMIAWHALEYGSYENIAEIRKLFNEAKDAFNDNRIINMYLGEPIESPFNYSIPENAPRWAILYRESIERLTDIVEWWIENRQKSNGSFGGGWDDDCEMWRNIWMPLLVAFESPATINAWKKLAEGVWNQPFMQGGYQGLSYANRLHDVQHSAEMSADTITSMLHAEPNNQYWIKKTLRLAELMETYWTGINERGGLQFKSTFFASDGISDDPVEACDTVYHTRVIQPVLLYWQRTGEPKLQKLCSEWIRAWVDASMRSERGKPAGIVPSAIHWPSGNVGGVGPDWWAPENYGNKSTYNWPSAAHFMTRAMLLTYYMTEDPFYLKPIKSMGNYRLNYILNPNAMKPIGSKMWCASKLGFINESLAKYRWISNNAEFDLLLIDEANPYCVYRIVNNSDKFDELIDAMEENLLSLKSNFEGYTSEVRCTDRVTGFPRILPEDSLLHGKEPNTGLLYSIATGDFGNAHYFPLNAVKWLTDTRDIAVFVTDSSKNGLTAKLYHFGDNVRTMGARFNLLSKGRYVCSLFEQEDNSSDLLKINTMEFDVEHLSADIDFRLPPQKVCIIKVEPK